MSQVSMDILVSLAKRRGFVFPSSEIYGGFASSYDYGPLGVALKNNLRDLWWRNIVDTRRTVEGIDGAIITHPKVWEASGHVAGFSDPLVDCKQCQRRHRADHLLEAAQVENVGAMTLEQMAAMLVELKITCPECSGELTPPRDFNLLVPATFGTTKDNTQECYLRGETCQTIFLDFKSVVETSRQRIPFGIAQIGKAFRNEITLENYIYRTREFEQMELQFFVHPNEENKWFEYWYAERLRWYQEELGIDEQLLHPREVGEDERAHYAKRAIDLEFDFPFGCKELEGLHMRGDYDLSNHMEASGVDLRYMDPITHEKYIPHVVETSVGLTRLFLAVFSSSYSTETVDGDERVVLRFLPSVAPVQVAVLPLSKKEELQDVSEKVFNELNSTFRCQYDETQSIGKRYRRQDEIGTPLCVTVDFDTLKDDAVTIRHRDTMQQERVPISGLSLAVTDQLTRF